ncbi:MAG TPA: isochorismatase family protein [Burkholderiaceae bacterium]|nr:isochorismatase family protein [Burkholderiaceae bacterium]
MTFEPTSDTLPLRADDALMIVDVQRDFLPGGSLAVAGSDAVIAPLNYCIARFVEHRLPVFASRDWHPGDHCSFRAAGGPWPPHCVADRPGAQFATALQLPAQAFVVSKGTASERDAYSAFAHTELDARLRDGHVRRLFIGGLATDYCVSASVLDALALGYRVVVLRDAVAAVDAADGAAALQRMQAAGAALASSRDLR